eukprot:TRINITY_DN12717_c0_g1_i1.p1 TRINITY_DN12717_c0_g1~~TRINITY_DN12717_c0_g1_i1.p1  ORF type:complete len:306 (+),score=86.21 TRINITY_DN12717_c0_g1_i1:46-963(+)
MTINVCWNCGKTLFNPKKLECGHVVCLSCYNEGLHSSTTCTSLCSPCSKKETIHQRMFRTDSSRLLHDEIIPPDFEKPDENGWLPIHHASKLGDVTTVRSLLAKNDLMIDATTKENELTCLILAAQFGHVKLVAALIDQDAEIDETDIEGHSALYWAAANGRIEVVELLIKCKANIELCSNNFRTPLHCAASAGWYEIVRVLLKAQANVDAKDKWNETALHKACVADNVLCAKELMKKGANIEAVNQWNETPLFLACKNGNIKTVTFLLTEGANFEIKRSDNLSCKDICQKEEFQNILQLFECYA